LLDAKDKVLLVLGRNGREVDGAAGEVDALLGAEQAAVLDLAVEVVVANLEDLDRDEPVVDEDAVARLDDLDDVLVVEVDELAGASVLVLLVRSQAELGALDQLLLGRGTLVAKKLTS
jgi:hypothetical protein